jgi:uncharacterized protein (TIGR03435 family)
VAERSALITICTFVGWYVALPVFALTVTVMARTENPAQTWSGGNDYPPLKDAVREQLGLELKPTKGPVTFWVVDHIERPTSN